MPAMDENQSLDFGLSVVNRHCRAEKYHIPMAESSTNSNHSLYQPKLFLSSFYSSEICPLSEYTIKLFNLAGFLVHDQQFSRLLDKFDVWVSCEAVWDIFYFLISFSVWCFKMEFNPLPHLLNTEFTNTEIGLFHGGEHFGAKICGLMTFFDKFTIFSRCRFSTYLIGKGDVWKHFKYWLYFSNIWL